MLQVINVTFEVFDITYGVVKVYDGEDSSSPVLGTFSGRVLPGYILSSSRHVYVSFETQSSSTVDEFLVSYIATQPGTHTHMYTI